MSYFFSIIIPVYNTEKLLPRALDSILNQDFDNNKIEVIVVNDGSPNANECRSIIKEYAKKLNIKFIDNIENQGLYMARKLGIENVSDSEGYLLHLDSDDYLNKNACKVLYEDIQKNGEADYIEFCYYSRQGIFKELSLIKKTQEDKIIEDVLSFKKNHTMWNKCYKISFVKNIYKNMPIFYSYYNEDYYQSGIIEFYAKKRRCLKTPLYVYILGSGVTSTKKYEKEKLRKMLISVFNVETNLCSFYKNKKLESHLLLIIEYCESLYRDIAVHSNIEEFIEVASEILTYNTIQNTLAKSIIKLEDRVAVLEKRMKVFQPIKIIAKPLISLFRIHTKNGL